MSQPGDPNMAATPTSDVPQLPPEGVASEHIHADSPAPGTPSQDAPTRDTPTEVSPEAEDMPETEPAATDLPASELPASETAGTHDTADMAAEPVPPVVPHAGLRYSLHRLLLLLAVGVLLYAVGLRGWLLLLLAFLVSGVLSYFVLMRSRNEAAANLEHAVATRRHAHPSEPPEQP